MDRPSHAENARTLLAYHDQGLLSTLDRESGAPYGSIAEYAPLDNGDALLFVSDLADHTKNIEDDRRASLLIADELGAPQPLRRPRVSMIGEVETCDPNRRSEYADRYLETHPHAELYIDFEDFAFYRLVPNRLRHVGGFGRMGWVDRETYRRADPDPIWPAAEGIRTHMNNDHDDAVLEMARSLGGTKWAKRAELTAVDRYGCDIRAEADGDGEEGPESEEIRITFDEPLDAAEEARPAFIELARRARS